MSFLRASSALFVSNILALGLQFVVVRCYGQRLGDEGLADYFVVLSIANAVGPFLACGLNDALSFLLGRKHAEPRTAQAMALQSVLFLSFTTAILALAVILFPERLSRLAFEAGDRRALLLATLLFMFSRGVFDLYCRYLLARKQILWPSLGMFLIPGLIPLGVLWIDPTQRLERLLFDASVLPLVLMGLSAFAEYRRHARVGALTLSMDSMLYLLRLGIPRMPTILGMSLLISCQAFLARKMHCSASEQAMIGGAMMILRTLAMTQRVVTSVVEPQIGQASVDRPQAIPVLLRTLALLSFATGVAVMAGLFSMGDAILQIMIKQSDFRASESTLLFWFSALPFTLLFVLRPCVNALSSRAYNTANMFYSLIGMGGTLLLAVLLAVPPAKAVGYATLLGGGGMAIFSLFTIQHLTKPFEKILLFKLRTWLLVVCSGGVLVIGKAVPMHENIFSVRSFVNACVVGGVTLLYMGTVACFAIRAYRVELSNALKLQATGPNHNPADRTEEYEI